MKILMTTMMVTAILKIHAHSAVEALLLMRLAVKLRSLMTMEMASLTTMIPVETQRTEQKLIGRAVILGMTKTTTAFRIQKMIA